MVPEKEDPPSRRAGRPKSEFSFIHHCVLCVIGVNTSLETVVPEKEDPPSRRAGRPKSEFAINFVLVPLCLETAE